MYLQRYEENELYNPKLSLSSIPSGKVGASFINPPTNKIRNLILRNPVDEALELTYNFQEDNTYLGLNMSKISGSLGTYTVAEADAKFRQISDSYAKTRSL